MKTLKCILLLALLLATAAGCDREDDIDEIFTGRTWYMNGGMVNGMKMNSDVRNFFVDGQPMAYSITFGARTFTGMFREDAPFSGTWSVDGKRHTIALTFDAKPSISSDFDHQMYNILRKVRTYESGASFLTLSEDRGNSIMFGHMR